MRPPIAHLVENIENTASTAGSVVRIDLLNCFANGSTLIPFSAHFSVMAQFIDVAALLGFACGAMLYGTVHVLFLRPITDAVFP